jgi:hypothetical protein
MDAPPFAELWQMATLFMPLGFQLARTASQLPGPGSGKLPYLLFIYGAELKRLLVRG